MIKTDISRPSLVHSITCVALLDRMNFTVYRVYAPSHACTQHGNSRGHVLPRAGPATPGGLRLPSPRSLFLILIPRRAGPPVISDREAANQSLCQRGISQPNLLIPEMGKLEFRGTPTVTAEEMPAGQTDDFLPRPEDSADLLSWRTTSAGCLTICCWCDENRQNVSRRRPLAPGTAEPSLPRGKNSDFH